jgi:FkbH-like protein
MITSLAHPLNLKEILQKRKAIRTDLLSRPGLKKLRVALLGGSTTSDLRSSLELFLLNDGFLPEFYESEYNRYYEDVLVDSAALFAFKPEFVVIHTTHVNLLKYPDLLDSKERVESLVRDEFNRFKSVWETLQRNLSCVIVQNNFDPPALRPLGHLEMSAGYGKLRYLSRLNLEFARYAEQNKRLLICDIHYLSALAGLTEWSRPEHWHSYKMAVSPRGAVLLAQHLARLIASASGRMKKCLVLDLDNTLWGGVIGDDGLENITLGRETPLGEAYLAFQQYCLDLSRRGVILAVCSKNDEGPAKSGFSHPDSILQLGNFAAFKANWEPKHENIRRIAAELRIGTDSIVFVDDNPAERALVAAQLPEVAVPDIGTDVCRFPEALDREGFFEPAAIVGDDLRRGGYYGENAVRESHQAAFATYGDYLLSLEMRVEMGAFSPTYLERIAQLTNKTNQFNLTTKRYSYGELEAIAADPAHVTFYCRLSDKFGDNGLVSVVIAQIVEEDLHLRLWLMSCRVIKRDVELAMMDALAESARARGLRRVFGYYLRTEKNGMVADHYKTLGFDPADAGNTDAASVWSLDLQKPYEPKNKHIKEIKHV